MEINDTPINSIGVESESNEIVKPIVTPEIVEEWKKWFLIQKFSLDTVDMYYSFIKRFVGYKVLVNQKSVDRFRESHMGTVSSSALKSLFKFLVYKKQFPENLLVIRFERNRQSRKLPKTISSDEVDKIIEGMESLRDKLMTRTMYSLALRIEECLKLLWSDISWSDWIKNKNEYGKINLKGTKRDKFRVLPVNPVLMNDLYDNHPNRTSDGIPIGNLLFGDTKKFMEIMSDKREGENLNKEQLTSRNKKYYLNLAKQRYRDLLYRVSKERIGRAISPHVLRHSKAQFLMDNNTPIESIQGLLGHESISTTQIYAKASVHKLQEDLKKFDSPGKKV